MTHEQVLQLIGSSDEVHLAVKREPDALLSLLQEARDMELDHLIPGWFVCFPHPITPSSPSYCTFLTLFLFPFCVASNADRMSLLLLLDGLLTPFLFVF